MKYFLINILVLLLFSPTVYAQTQKPEKKLPIKQQLIELNKSFTYKGKPVHPRAVQDLISWLPDNFPGPVAIDAAGSFDSNRYAGDYSVKDEGLVFIDLTQEFLKQPGWFGYRHLGRLANGYHVLDTYLSGGGTGIFQSLLLVECLTDFEYKSDGSRRERLVIKRMGEFPIGDRYTGKIKLDSKNNTIAVGADKQNVEKPYKIKIQ